MALVLQDRVRVNSADFGTGDITLGAPYPGYRSFTSCIPDGSIVYYCIHNTSVGYDTEWEVGYGTYTLGTNSLSRDNVYSSSNANALVNFTSGANGLEVFITQPSEQAVFQDPDGTTTFPEGIISVVGANATAPSFPTTLSSFVSNEDSYSQMVLQNQSADANASSDIVAYNNLGDGASYFVDMGINSSAYNSVDYPIFTENSAYVFSGGDIAGTGAAGETSDLFVGTSTANSNVHIFAGGVDTTDKIVTIYASSHNVSFDNNISVTANVSANNVNVTNFVYSGANLSNAANSTVLVTQAYVDNAVSAGLTIHPAVRLEQGTNLNATYNQPGGAGVGVGATLTNAGTQVALSVDGVATAVNDRILVYGQTNAAQNGVYTVTNIGSGSTNWVLTRATDADTYGAANPNKLGQGSYFYITSGNTGAGESYVVSTTGTITFGSTNITFSLFSATPTFTGTAPINVSGQTIALTGVVNEAHGGTNASTYTTGDIIYANATNTLAKLAIGSQYNALTVDAGGVPHWSAIALGSANAVSGTLGATNGGTGQSTYTLGDIIYSDGANSLAKLAGQTTVTKKYLSQTGDGVNSAAPAWAQVAAADISGLAPSATTDTSNASNITSGTLPTGRISGSYTGLTGTGNLTTGTWSANVITTTYGGTGAAGTLSGLVYGNGASAMSAATAAQVVAVIGSTAVANATYAVSSNSSTYTTNIIGGAAGSIPYQTAANTTALLATSSGVLVGGATPSYSTTPTLTGTNFSGIPNSATTATAANTASAIVARDASGNFTAGTITANLTGTASSATSATNATNVAVTEDTATATAIYPTLVGANTGNNPIKTTSTKLTFVPSTGVLSATTFSGSGASLTSIPNAGLVNSAVTINGTSVSLGSSGTVTANTTAALTAGTGISYSSGTTFNGGTALTISNSGVTSAAAGTGISVSGSTGAVTFTNSGVTSIVAGTNVTISGSTGAVTINASGGLSLTNDTTTNATYYPTLTTATTGSISAANTSSTKLFFNPSTGLLTATSMSSNSDERLKEDWQDVSPTFLVDLAKVKHGTFKRIDAGNREPGVTAQSLQAVLPEAVAEGADGYLSVNYGGAALVAAIELAKVVEELRAEVKELKAKLANGA